MRRERELEQKLEEKIEEDDDSDEAAAAAVVIENAHLMSKSSGGGGGKVEDATCNTDSDAESASTVGKVNGKFNGAAAAAAEGWSGTGHSKGKGKGALISSSSGPGEQDLPHLYDADGDGNPRVPWGGRSSTSCLAVFTHLFGLCLTLLLGPAAFLPAFMWCYSIYQDKSAPFPMGGKLSCIVWIPIAMSITQVVVSLVVALVSRALMCGVGEGAYPVWGPTYLRWWISQNLVRLGHDIVLPLFHDTFVMRVWLRALGAEVGERAQIRSNMILTPTMVKVGDDALVDRNALLLCHAVENGFLILRKVELGDHAEVACRAFVVPGTSVPANHRLTALATTGLGRQYHMTKVPERVASAPRGHGAFGDFLRILVGVPIILAMQAWPYIPGIYLLELLYPALLSAFGGNETYAYVVFCVLSPWVSQLVMSEIYFWSVVAFKRILVPRFVPGRVDDMQYCGLFPDNFLFTLSKWTLEGLFKSPAYAQGMGPWISTEVLNWKLRALGASVGSGVHPDNFECVEYDLVHVGKNAVFGSSVSLLPCDGNDTVQRYIAIRDGAQVLDHCTLEQGVVVSDGALCGSCTVGNREHVFPPHSISTGNVSGKPVLLRVHEGSAEDLAESGLSFMPPEEQRVVRQARAAHHSTCSWGLFNVVVCLSAIVCAPFLQIAYIGTVVLWLWLQDFAVFSGNSALSWVLTGASRISASLYLCISIRVCVCGGVGGGGYSLV